jgi:hypothetical protein
MSPRYRPGRKKIKLPKSRAGSSIGITMLIRKTGMAKLNETLNALRHSVISLVFDRDSS